MLIVGVLLFTVLVRFLLLALLVPWMLSPGPACPACGAPDTDRVHARWAWLLGEWAEYRWCLACGWSGLLRGPSSVRATL